MAKAKKAATKKASTKKAATKKKTATKKANKFGGSPLAFDGVPGGHNFR